jgi:seryl-tRNA synthetase
MTEQLSLDQPGPAAEQPSTPWRLELDAERQQLAVERAELAAEREEIAAERKRLAAERQRLLAQQSETEEARTAAAEAADEVQAAPPGTVESDDDIFARLRALSVLREESKEPTSEEAADAGDTTVEPTAKEVEEAVAPVQAEVESTPRPETSAPPAAHGEHEG